MPFSGGTLEDLANVVAVAFVLQFCWSYYWNCYRKGYTMDIWHFALLYNLFVVHVMLPFSRSDLNVVSIGYHLRTTQAHVTEAYFISAAGYLSIVLGGELWRLKLGAGLRTFIAGMVESLARGSLLLLNSRFLLTINGVFASLVTAGVLAYYFKREGFGFNLRGLLLVVPALRPIAQFAAFYSVLIGSYCLARYYQRRERLMLAVLLLVAVGLIFFGERGNLVAVAVMTAQGLIILKGRRLRLSVLVLSIVGTLSFIMLMDALRLPNFSVQAAVGGSLVSIFYGNSFSDTRDFALVLGHWNGQPYYGLTYLAGLLAFVPRFLLPFRDTYALGVVTATIAGFKPTEHPGLRVGLFGEAYLNFGLPAVILLGFFIGAVVRLVDSRMKQAAHTLPRNSLVIFSYLGVLAWVGVAENSTAASALYTTLVVFGFSWVCLRVARVLRLAV